MCMNAPEVQQHNVQGFYKNDKHALRAIKAVLKCFIPYLEL